MLLSVSFYLSFTLDTIRIATKISVLFGEPNGALNNAEDEKRLEETVAQIRNAMIGAPSLEIYISQIAFRDIDYLVLC